MTQDELLAASTTLGRITEQLETVVEPDLQESRATIAASIALVNFSLLDLARAIPAHGNFHDALVVMVRGDSPL